MVVDSAEVAQDDHLIVFRIEASHYLWKMVRRLTGTLVKVGLREITVDGNGMATGVIYYDENGVEHPQKAEVVILACNGIGTPRLLLNSKS